jgi:hypothetical protein
VRRHLTVVLLLCLVGAAGFWAYVRIRASIRSDDPRSNPPDDPEQQLCCRVPVSDNCGPDVVEGFRGGVHPFLHRHARTEVTAAWIPPKTDSLDPRAPLELRQLYMNVSPAVSTATYSERDFSAFLPPENTGKVGQMWTLDLDRVAVFLKQFHPAVSMHSASVGRRPGPDGGFAVLRGVCASHVDVVFRIHAEFDLLPKTSDLLVHKAWYSPACFLGRLVVNRDRGTVEYFQLGVPTEKATNVHVTWWGANNTHAHNTQRVDRMELLGGSLSGVDGIHWARQLPLDPAHERLATAFYKFKEIHFLPFDQALAAAREQKQPILAVVLLGALDDQSC